ncbi:hypothetical protein D1BOALGB6SA_9081 [Olavius sp. associated proteobacterium Delta 1]|nr:hypothetical protein D1BOALGB6SA_9081 [Olavius sp. associated proteobacterium Delta 1]
MKPKDCWCSFAPNEIWRETIYKIESPIATVKEGLSPKGRTLDQNHQPGPQ